MTAPARRPDGLVARIAVPGRLDVALRARAGEVVAVIGPNGAGKSTLLHAVAGLVPMTGTLEVAGEDWTGRRVPDRSLGLVFQDRSLFPHLSARENVAFGLRSRGTPRRRAATEATAWLRRFGIGELADRRPGDLSGGQAQRVAIARALAVRPRVLLLDEPFAGLDVGVAAALRLELARHLADFDGVALLVTHDAFDALTLASQVVVLDRGRVAQVGEPHRVAAEPRTEHVARLVGLNVLADGDDLVSFPPSAVTVSIGEPAGSARLRWPGTIRAAVPHGDAVRLVTDVAALGRELLADVTPAATAELGLAGGVTVWLSVKATAVRRYEALPEPRHSPITFGP